jgi:hypothetical protein
MDGYRRPPVAVHRSPAAVVGRRPLPAAVGRRPEWARSNKTRPGRQHERNGGFFAKGCRAWVETCAIASAGNRRLVSVTT